MMKELMRMGAIALVVASLGGCAAMAGAGAAGGAYEYQNKKQLEQLEEDFKQGEINRQEYLERKKAIEEGSVIY